MRICWPGWPRDWGCRNPRCAWFGAKLRGRRPWWCVAPTHPGVISRQAVEH